MSRYSVLIVGDDPDALLAEHSDNYELQASVPKGEAGLGEPMVCSAILDADGYHEDDADPAWPAEFQARVDAVPDGTRLTIALCEAP